MHACVCVGKTAEAMALLEPLRTAAGAVGRPVVSAHNLLMKPAAAAADPTTARKLFADMRRRGLAPDVVTYNTLLSAFVSAGEPLRARAVADKMSREGVPQDNITRSLLVTAAARQGTAALSEEWAALVDAGHEPTMV
jgi:pentatricopeptide repeat protein